VLTSKFIGRWRRETLRNASSRDSGLRYCVRRWDLGEGATVATRGVRRLTYSPPAVVQVEFQVDRRCRVGGDEPVVVPAPVPPRSWDSAALSLI